MNAAQAASRLRQVAIEITEEDEDFSAERWARELDEIADWIDPVLTTIRKEGERHRAEQGSGPCLEAEAPGSVRLIAPQTYIAKLEDDLDALKAALEQIADPSIVDGWRAQSIARAALERPE